MRNKHKAKRYIVWDGTTEVDYLDEGSGHDCVISSDGELLSVQKRRREILENNNVPTVVFACKRGETVMEQPIGGKVRGVFSHCWRALLEHDPNVTFRDAVRLVNECMKQNGVKQTCEVVCREDVLDMGVMCSSLDDAAHVLMFLDMCRTESKAVGPGPSLIFSMRTVTIEPQNPLDVRADDLAPLLADLRRQLTAFDVELAAGTAMPAGARGVTWWEVVHVYLPEIAADARGAVVAIVLEAAYRWARERFRRKREHGIDKRPKCVVIHRADRSEETSMVLLGPHHKPKTTEEALNPSQRPTRGRKKRRRTAAKGTKKITRPSPKKRK